MIADAAKLKHAGKDDASSKGTELRKDAEVYAADAGKEIDRLAQQARDGTHKVDQKLEEYRQRADKSIDQTIKQTGAELNKAVDSFDKNVAQVRRAISSLQGAFADNPRVLTRPRVESLAGSALASKMASGAVR